MSSALKFFSNKFSHLDDWHHLNKFSLLLVVLAFGAIPLTIFGIITFRQLSAEAGTGVPTNMKPENLKVINTSQPKFSWHCYCYTSRYRIYLREGDGTFFAGSWYKDVTTTAADSGGWKVNNYKTFTGFASGKKYFWAVACTPGYGSCNTSATQNFTVDTTAPNAPYLTYNGVSYSTDVNMSWKASFDNVTNQGFIRYVLERSQNGGPFIWACQTIGTTLCVDRNWEGSMRYTYAVRAFDGVNNASNYSNFVEVITPERDFDNDGFKDHIERWVGTNVRSNCGADAWPADFDSNGKVDVADQQILAYNYGGTNRRYDLNATGTINSLDQAILALFVGKTC